MPMPSFTPAQWQERARRVRSIIGYLADPSARNEMALLARAYEQLASEAAVQDRRPTAPGSSGSTTR